MPLKYTYYLLKKYSLLTADGKSDDDLWSRRDHWITLFGLCGLKPAASPVWPVIKWKQVNSPEDFPFPALIFQLCF